MNKPQSAAIERDQQHRPARSANLNRSLSCGLASGGQRFWNDKPAERRAARQELTHRILRLQQRVRRAHADSVMAMVAAVEARDPYTEQHSIHVAAYAEELARRAGFSTSQIEIITLAALLHDVGKIALPDSILKKPGPLTTDEFEHVKLHPQFGVSILKPLEFLDEELTLILCHHEWFNGSGYPHGLAGNAIPIGARVVQVADCIDAMLSPRSYRHARTIPETILELQRCRGTQFDPNLAVLAIEWLREQRPVDKAAH